MNLKHELEMALAAAKDEIRPAESRLNNVIARLENILNTVSWLHDE